MEGVGAEVDVVGPGPAGPAGQHPAEAATETALADAHGRAVQIERAVHVEDQHPAGRPVEGGSGETRGQRRGHILRHADHLKVALALRRGRRGLRVGIDQRAADRQAASRERHRAGRHRVLVEAGVVERGPAGRRVTRDTVTVGAGIGRVDGGVLHLDDQHQVADRDRGGRAGRRSERDRS